MRLAVAATPHIALPSLDAILHSQHQLLRVFTQPDRPAGRGQKISSSPVSQWARDNKVPLFQPIASDEMAELLTDIDCVITIGYGVLLPESILAIPVFGFLNLHFSLLPRWRGAAPVQRAIEAGDAYTGVTVFKLDRGMDTGPIYLREEIELHRDWNTGIAMDVLSKLGGPAILQALSMIEDGIQPTPQESTGSTRALKLSHEEGQIDWNLRADEIVRKILAFSPQPGAWTYFRGANLKIEQARVKADAQDDENLQLKPGEIRRSNAGIIVGTGKGFLHILSLRPAGKQTMSVKDWVNGARIVPGEIFG